mmetsp:Transcript_99667/g.304699  ORF Transcript_99667/g.304699 Transcript_99667/m.304699 type:complete len:212 (+) Transcript_99667:972-1607(+)
MVLRDRQKTHAVQADRTSAPFLCRHPFNGLVIRLSLRVPENGRRARATPVARGVQIHDSIAICDPKVGVRALPRCLRGEAGLASLRDEPILLGAALQRRLAQSRSDMVVVRVHAHYDRVLLTILHHGLGLEDVRQEITLGRRNDDIILDQDVGQRLCHLAQGRTNLTSTDGARENAEEAFPCPATIRHRATLGNLVSPRGCKTLAPGVRTA